MLLLKVHKGHLTRSYVHMAIQNISVPYIILPFRILYYFRSVPFREIYPTDNKQCGKAVWFRPAQTKTSRSDFNWLLVIYAALPFVFDRIKGNFIV